MFNYSIYYFQTDNETEDTRPEPRATDSGDSSTIPSVSGVTDSGDHSTIPCSSSIPSVSGVSAPLPPAAPAAAAVCPTGRVLTQAVLESQEEIVRAIGGINDRLDQLIGVLTNIGDSINALVNK